MRFDDNFNDPQFPKSNSNFNNEIDNDLEFSDLEYEIPQSDDIMTDIESETVSEKHKKSSDKSRGKNKKTAIIVCSVVAAAVIVAAALFLIFSGIFGSDNPDNPPSDGESITLTVEDLSLDGVASDYLLANGINVNGVDLSLKTVAQAKKLLSNVEKSLTFDFSYTVMIDKAAQILKSDNLEYEFDTEKVLATAVKYTESLGKSAYDEGNPVAKIDITCKLNDKDIDKFLNDFSDKFNKKPKDAKITAFHPWEENKFEYEQSVDGLKIDQKQLKTEFNKLFKAKSSKGTITAKTTVDKAKVTVDFLKKNIVPLSSAWTYSTNTANANNNMKVALERSNGAIIGPGEVYSFSGHAGNTNLASEGYMEATVISVGQYIQEIGGGVCQAATTIYDAAIYANLEVVERYGHLWCSTYTKSGFDATISYGSLDVKLRNKTEYPVFLETRMDGTKLICNMYGYQDPSYDNIATYSYNFDYYSGKEYSTRAYRIYLKDGVEVDREYLDTTTYSLTEGHYVVDSDRGTVGAKPGGEPYSVSIALDPNDGPLYDLNTEKPTERPTERPTEPPTDPPTSPTEPSSAQTEPTQTEPEPSSDETDPPEPSSDNTDPNSDPLE